MKSYLQIKAVFYDFFEKRYELNQATKLINTPFFDDFFAAISAQVMLVDQSILVQVASLVKRVSKAGGKVIIIGNGGSAAMASHVSVDFTKAANVRAINFNEADLITCFANDYGYERWLEKSIEVYADSKDLVLAISSSGRSPNIINAAIKAKEQSIPLVTLSGFNFDNPLRSMGQINLWVESSSYNVVEMTHHIWLLAVVDFLQAEKI